MIQLTSCLAVVVLAAQESRVAGASPATYELYSWQRRDADWNFCFLGTTDRQKTVKEVLNKKTALRGLEELKRKISDIPKRSTIVWFDRLMLDGAKTKGSESLGYPPPNIRQEIRDYVEDRQMELIEGTDYLLYSWEALDGKGWKFQLLRVSNHENTVDEIFDERTVLQGLDELKAKISASAEPGSYIVWADARAVRGKGGDHLQYPTADVVGKIRRDARRRDIQIAGPPGRQITPHPEPR
jgi:hypothetical protein